MNVIRSVPSRTVLRSQAPAWERTSSKLRFVDRQPAYFDKTANAIITARDNDNVTALGIVREAELRRRPVPKPELGNEECHSTADTPVK